jgi:hypothetical protein
MGKAKNPLSTPDSAIRWLGPYPPSEPKEEDMPGYESKKISSAMRHADDITLAELVRLRVENGQLKDEIEDLTIRVERRTYADAEYNLNREKEIERLREALRKIANIEHEDIPAPQTSNEGLTWTVLAMAVGLAEKALKEGK